MRMLLISSLALGGAFALVRAATLPVPHPAVAAHPAVSAAVTAATASPAAAAPPAGEARSHAAPGMSSSPATPLDAASAATGIPDPLDGEVSDTVVQQILSASSPEDLPAAAAAHLVALARAYLTADLTGAGRSRFGSWSGPPTYLQDSLRVQAAIARRHQSRSDVADVTVIYTVADPAGGAAQHRAVISFARTGTGWALACNPVLGSEC